MHENSRNPTYSDVICSMRMSDPQAVSTTVSREVYDRIAVFLDPELGYRTADFLREAIIEKLEFLRAWCSSFGS